MLAALEHDLLELTAQRETGRRVRGKQPRTTESLA